MRQSTYAFVVLLLSAGCGCAVRNLEHSGRVLFFGDSITQLADTPDGYLSLLRAYAAASGRSVEIINAGISGNKVTDLRARLSKDVIAKNPSTVVVYIGINDVWHWQLPKLRGTPRDTFETVLGQLVDDVVAHSARVVLCTPSVIGERKGRTNPQDSMLDEYAEVTRTVARAHRVQLCDLRQAFVRALEQQNSADADRGILTTDRVHLNAAGNRLVAHELAAVLGWNRAPSTSQ